MSFEGEVAFKGEITLADVADTLVLECGGRVINERWVSTEVLLSM